MVTHTARVWINRVRLPVLHVIFPCPRSCLRSWSRETGSAVPSHVSLLISILRLNLMLTYGIPPEFRGGVHLFLYNHHTTSGQSRAYRVRSLPRVRQRVSTIGGGGDTTIPSPWRSLKQPLPGIGLHNPLHGWQACLEFNPFQWRVGQISPREGLF